MRSNHVKCKTLTRQKSAQCFLCFLIRQVKARGAARAIHAIQPRLIKVDAACKGVGVLPHFIQPGME